MHRDVGWCVGKIGDRHRLQENIGGGVLRVFDFIRKRYDRSDP